MNRDRLMSFVFAGIIFVVFSLSSGCGYRLYRHADLPFHEVRIGNIENMTLEPGLQDVLHRVLAEEFSRQGIVISSGAQHVLTAKIHHFSMSILSEKKDIAIEYRVIIRADFSFTDSAGTTRQLRDAESPFFIILTASEDLATLFAQKTILEERALRDVAQQVIGALIYHHELP